MKPEILYGSKKKMENGNMIIGKPYGLKMEVPMDGHFHFTDKKWMQRQKKTVLKMIKICPVDSSEMIYQSYYFRRGIFKPDFLTVLHRKSDNRSNETFINSNCWQMLPSILSHRLPHELRQIWHYPKHGELHGQKSASPLLPQKEGRTTPGHERHPAAC